MFWTLTTVNSLINLPINFFSCFAERQLVKVYGYNMGVNNYFSKHYCPVKNIGDGLKSPS